VINIYLQAHLSYMDWCHWRWTSLLHTE